jgi:hypothetical protein
LIAVEWVNDGSGGYDLADFKTDAAGGAIQSTLTMYRAAQERGAEMILTRADLEAELIGTLAPC